MSEIFNTTFEDNHLYQYPVSNGFHAVYVDGGTIEVNGSSKHNGNYGCEITGAQYSKACGIQYTEPLTRFRQRFYFHGNNLSIADGASLYLARNYHSDASRILYAIALYRGGSTYYIYTALSDNSELLVGYSGDTAISMNTWNYIETDWQSGSPGSLKTYLNGAQISTISQTNNLSRVIYPALGVTHYRNHATTGSFYVDDWVANDDGSSIGA